MTPVTSAVRFCIFINRFGFGLNCGRKPSFRFPFYHFRQTEFDEQRDKWRAANRPPAINVYEEITQTYTTCAPAFVAEWLTHSSAMCSRAWRAQWPGFDSARARLPTKELFLIIPTHMMNREIIPGRKKESSTVSSINCDRCRQLDLAVSNLPAAPAWVEANRLGWPLVGVINSASQS